MLTLNRYVLITLIAIFVGMALGCGAPKRAHTQAVPPPAVYPITMMPDSGFFQDGPNVLPVTVKE